MAGLFWLGSGSWCYRYSSFFSSHLTKADVVDVYPYSIKQLKLAEENTWLLIFTEQIPWNPVNMSIFRFENLVHEYLLNQVCWESCKFYLYCKCWLTCVSFFYWSLNYHLMSLYTCKNIFDQFMKTAGYAVRNIISQGYVETRVCLAKLRLELFLRWEFIIMVRI